MTDHDDDGLHRRAAAALSASRRSDIASFIVMDVMRAAAAREAAGERIVHMEVGQPGTPAPAGARAALLRRMDEGDPLGYTQALGLPELRARISRHYRETYGLDVPAARIIVTSGSSAGFVLAFLALFDAGDRVALPQPGYPCYRNILSALGCTPVMLETGPETRWMPLPDQIDTAAGDLAGLLVASPANPTGTMIEPARLSELIDACRRRAMWFISDEIYHGLTYERPAATALAVSDDAIVINSFSKYFSMTGWRVGWMVVPERLVRPIEKLAQNLYISPPTPSQVAAAGAFDSLGELEANRAVYAANRALLLDGLPAVGFPDIVPADGAFYLYCNIAHLTRDSGAFARAMLEETGIAATPGIDFDPVRGKHFMRFSYAGKTADMTEALERLARWNRLRG